MSEQLALQQAKKPSFMKKMSKHLKKLLKFQYLYLMLIPFFLYYALFYFKPFSGLRIAFMDYKPFLGLDGSQWVGFENFIKFFTGPYFSRIMRNTVTISLYNLIFGFPVPIILAFLFYEVRNNRVRSIVQTISYMPRFISAVVVAGMVVNFLSPSSGVINFIIEFFGHEPIYFLAKPEYFKPIYVTQSIWSGAGFGSVIYYSALCSIDTELFEAVKIDGGGRWSQLRNVALPGIMPTIGIILILQVGGILNVGFEMVILLYQPVTYSTADIIGSYVYRVGIESSNYSMSTAVGLFNGVISLIMVFSANRVAKKIGSVSIF